MEEDLHVVGDETNGSTEELHSEGSLATPNPMIEDEMDWDGKDDDILDGEEGDEANADANVDADVDADLNVEEEVEEAVEGEGSEETAGTIEMTEEENDDANGGQSVEEEDLIAEEEEERPVFQAGIDDDVNVNDEENVVDGVDGKGGADEALVDLDEGEAVVMKEVDEEVDADEIEGNVHAGMTTDSTSMNKRSSQEVVQEEEKQRGKEDLVKAITEDASLGSSTDTSFTDQEATALIQELNQAFAELLNCVMPRSTVEYALLSKPTPIQLENNETNRMKRHLSHFFNLAKRLEKLVLVKEHRKSNVTCSSDIIQREILALKSELAEKEELIAKYSTLIKQWAKTFQHLQLDIRADPLLEAP